MMETTISFLSAGLAVWRLSRNQFKPVWAESVENYPSRKLELLIPHSSYIGHQCGVWKIMGKAIFFCKKVVIDLGSGKSARGRWSWAKNCRFSNACKLFSFLAKLNFLKDSFTTTLNLLDFIGLWPIFSLFHYAKLPSYKRVRWGRLAGPSYILWIIAWALRKSLGLRPRDFPLAQAIFHRISLFLS